MHNIEDTVLTEKDAHLERLQKQIDEANDESINNVVISLLFIFSTAVAKSYNQEVTPIFGLLAVFQTTLLYLSMNKLSQAKDAQRLEQEVNQDV